MNDELDLRGFFCPNPECLDYGRIDKGNIAVKERYGRKNTALLLCKTCGRTFSENRGTPFFGLHATREEFLQAIGMLVEKGSIRGVARATGRSINTIRLWLDRAGKHSEQVSRHLMRDLGLTQVQVDELWTFIKKKKPT